MISRVARPIADVKLFRRSAVILGIGLLSCCGCPLQRTPPQQQQVPTRWITVELVGAGNGVATSEGLQLEDCKAIIATLPTISILVAERTHAATLHSETGEAEAQICGTDPEYLDLLTDASGVEVLRGRFLSDADAAQSAAVIVLSNKLADLLFGEADPIGEKVDAGGEAVTVVGVVGGGHESLIDGVQYDAYVPHHLELRAFAETTPDATQLDRIRIRVNRLDEVEDTRAVVRNLIEQRHPDAGVSVD